MASWEAARRRNLFQPSALHRLVDHPRHPALAHAELARDLCLLTAGAVQTHYLGVALRCVHGLTGFPVVTSNACHSQASPFGHILSPGSVIIRSGRHSTITGCAAYQASASALPV